MEDTAAEGERSAADGGIDVNHDMSSESKDEADGTEAERADDQQQQQEHQHKGDDDDGGVLVEEGEGEGGKKHVGEDTPSNAEGEHANDVAGVEPAVPLEKKPNTHRDGLEASADHTSAVAAEIKEGEQEVAHDQSVGGEVEPPLSPQQQQHASSSNEVQGNGGSGGSASNLAPSAPLAPTWPAYCDPTYRMPEELPVRVVVDGEVKEMSIKVERFEGDKVFQGGYRHRGTGRVFHHASTQFGQRERPVKQTGHLRTRDTQTCKIKTITMQTTNECGTQVSLPLSITVRELRMKVDMHVP